MVTKKEPGMPALVIHIDWKTQRFGYSRVSFAGLTNRDNTPELVNRSRNQRWPGLRASRSCHNMSMCTSGNLNGSSFETR